MPIKVTVKKNLSAEYLKKLKEACQQATIDTAQQVADLAGALAPVDTGAMSQGFYVITSAESGYDEAAARAIGLRPEQDKILDSVEPPDNEYTARVSNTQSYQPDQELGGDYNDAQPHLIPAAEATRQYHIDAVTQAIKGINV